MMSHALLHVVTFSQLIILGQEGSFGFFAIFGLIINFEIHIITTSDRAHQNHIMTLKSIQPKVMLIAYRGWFIMAVKGVFYCIIIMQ